MNKKLLLIGLVTLIVVGSVGYSLFGGTSPDKTLKGSIGDAINLNMGLPAVSVRRNAEATQRTAQNARRQNRASLRETYLAQLVEKANRESQLTGSYRIGLGLLNQLSCGTRAVSSARRTEMGQLIQNLETANRSFALLNQNGGLAHFDLPETRRDLSNNLGSINYALTTINAFIQNIDGNCISQNTKESIWPELYDSADPSFMTTANEMDRLYSLLSQ